MRNISPGSIRAATAALLLTAFQLPATPAPARPTADEGYTCRPDLRDDVHPPSPKTAATKRAIQKLERLVRQLERRIGKGRLDAGAYDRILSAAAPRLQQMEQHAASCGHELRTIRERLVSVRRQLDDAMLVRLGETGEWEDLAAQWREGHRLLANLSHDFDLDAACSALERMADSGAIEARTRAALERVFSQLAVGDPCWKSRDCTRYPLLARQRAYYRIALTYELFNLGAAPPDDEVAGVLPFLTEALLCFEVEGDRQHCSRETPDTHSSLMALPVVDVLIALGSEHIPDTDEDGLPDVVDECPSVPESPDDCYKADGCPGSPC